MLSVRTNSLKIEGSFPTHALRLHTFTAYVSGVQFGLSCLSFSSFALNLSSTAPSRDASMASWSALFRGNMTSTCSTTSLAGGNAVFGGELVSTCSTTSPGLGEDATIRACKTIQTGRTPSSSTSGPSTTNMLIFATSGGKKRARSRGTLLNLMTLYDAHLTLHLVPGGNLPLARAQPEGDSALARSSVDLMPGGTKQHEDLEEAAAASCTTSCVLEGRLRRKRSTACRSTPRSRESLLRPRGNSRPSSRRGRSRSAGLKLKMKGEAQMPTSRLRGVPNRGQLRCSPRREMLPKPLQRLMSSPLPLT